MKSEEQKLNIFCLPKPLIGYVWYKQPVPTATEDNGKIIFWEFSWKYFNFLGLKFLVKTNFNEVYPNFSDEHKIRILSAIRNGI